MPSVQPDLRRKGTSDCARPLQRPRFSRGRPGSDISCVVPMCESAYVGRTIVGAVAFRRGASGGEFSVGITLGPKQGGLGADFTDLGKSRPQSRKLLLVNLRPMQK
jgi:hypothetical protein